MGWAEPVVELAVAVGLVGIFAVVLTLRGEELVLWRPLKKKDTPEPTPYRKFCPYCAQQVTVLARKCPYCREWLDPELLLRASGLLLAAITVVGMLLLLRLHVSHGPRLHQLLKELGGAVAPGVTRLVFSLPYALLTLGALAALLVLGFVLPGSLRRRNLILGASAAGASVLITLQYYGLLAPFFVLAAAIR